MGSGCVKSALLLLDFSRCTGLFEPGFGCFGFLFGDAFANRLWSRVNDVFCFLEAKAGELTHSLDDLNLLSTDVSENNVKLRLFFFYGGGTGTGIASGGDGHRGGCGDAKALFECLDELGEIKD
jgi:hypothetical protein